MLPWAVTDYGCISSDAQKGASMAETAALTQALFPSLSATAAVGSVHLTDLDLDLVGAIWFPLHWLNTGRVGCLEHVGSGEAGTCGLSYWTLPLGKHRGRVELCTETDRGTVRARCRACRGRLQPTDSQLGTGTLYHNATTTIRSSVSSTVLIFHSVECTRPCRSA